MTIHYDIMKHTQETIHADRWGNKSKARAKTINFNWEANMKHEYHIHSNDPKLNRIDLIATKNRKRRKIVGLTLSCMVAIFGLCMAGSDAPNDFLQVIASTIGVCLFLLGGIGVYEINAADKRIEP
jgi:hypothetical protein